MPQLQTERLTLTPFTRELVHAALHDKAELARLLGASVPDAWPGSDFAEVLPWLAHQLTSDPSAAEWNGLIIQRADRLVIGDMGLKGQPDARGTVEIGYSIIPAYRGQGYAPEMARALVAWALHQPDIQRVTAECLAHNLASIRVLEKVGMQRTGTAHGLLYWELSRAQASENEHL
jgi:ribosomal-protein-alanine N-acetyltransferase